MFCREEAAQLRELNRKSHELGSSLIIIGNGSPDEAAAFQQGLLEGEVRLLTDPSLTSYKAMQLKRSLFASVKPRTFLRALTLRRKGGRFSANVQSAEAGWVSATPNDPPPWPRRRDLEQDEPVRSRLPDDDWFNVTDVARALQNRPTERKPSGSAGRDARELIARWMRDGIIEVGRFGPARRRYFRFA